MSPRILLHPCVQESKFQQDNFCFVVTINKLLIHEIIHVSNKLVCSKNIHIHSIWLDKLKSERNLLEQALSINIPQQAIAVRVKNQSVFTLTTLVISPTGPACNFKKSAEQGRPYADIDLSLSMPLPEPDGDWSSDSVSVRLELPPMHNINIERNSRRNLLPVAQYKKMLML